MKSFKLLILVLLPAFTINLSVLQKTNEQGKMDTQIICASIVVHLPIQINRMSKIGVDDIKTKRFKEMYMIPP